MAQVLVRDRSGALVAIYPRNKGDVPARMSTAQCNALKSAIDSLGRFPADGGKFPLGLTYPGVQEFESSLPLDTGYATSVVTGDAWD